MTDKQEIVLMLLTTHMLVGGGEFFPWAKLDANYVEAPYNKPVGFYGPIAPPGPNARQTSCPIPSSERAQIPNIRTRSILN